MPALFLENEDDDAAEVSNTVYEKFAKCGAHHAK
jgi:hypothetical protein